MRRFLLVLTFFSFAGWSQPAQQQAQLPLQTTNSAQPPVNPPNPWTQFGSLAPGIIAALSALVAIWLTQRHQLRLEIAKAEIAAKYRSQDNRWAFRKDVYVNLITATSGLIRAWSGIAANMRVANQLKQEGTPLTDIRMTGVIQRLTSDINGQEAHGATFATYVSLSPLAIAEDVVPLVTTTWESFKDLDLSAPELIAANMPEKQKALGELLRKLQAAGRKDLWGTPEPEAKTEPTTKG